MSPTDRISLLFQAEQLLKKEHFSREDASRAEQFIALADRATSKDELHRASLRERGIELGRLSPDSESLPTDVQFRNYLMTGKIEQRAQGVTTDAGGNYIVPEQFAVAVESALKKIDGVFDACSTFTVSRGSAFPYPLLEDTNIANAATIIGESVVSVAGPDLAFEKVDFGKCPQWRSGMIRCSIELVQDSLFPIEQLLATAAGVRLARGIGASMITTLLAGSTSALTAAGTTALTADEILSLCDSIDDAYLTNASFCTTRTVLGALYKLKTTSGGAYVFPAERNAAGLPMLAGYPVYVSPSMPAMTAGLKPIVFGDLSRLARRIVGNSLVARVLVERYAEYSQIGCETLYRTDAELLKTSATQPTKFITMHA